MIILTLAAIGLVAVLFYTSRIRWYVAFPLICLLILAAGAVQAAHANANVRVRWSMRDGQCYRYSVTEHRTGITGGILGDLWHLNQRLDWCQSTPGGTVWSGPTVHRSHGTNALWIWGGYEAKTRVRHLSNPSRWQVYVKAGFHSAPDVFGVTEHNYPAIRMTIWRDNPTHVHYSASCGC